MMEFQAWPKTPRLNRPMCVTEKIDGTNAAVIITDDGQVGAQSRNRLITPESDNFGFAAWVYANADSLAAELGPGRHFGEWWGGGIQRGYRNPFKTLSLFNADKWEGVEFDTLGLECVPVLYRGPFSTEAIDRAVAGLRAGGSHLDSGTPAEGVAVWHSAARQVFKVLLENDEGHKGAAA